MIPVNLWAGWCQPCQRELDEFTAKQSQLRSDDIDVVALSAEGVSEDKAGGGVDARPLQAMQFPFRAGLADASLIERLQLLHDTIFELHAPLPIPTSFLLDRKGRVVAVYKGPVAVKQLLADSSKLRAVKSTHDSRMATLPFEGRWVIPPRQRDLFGYVEQLADRGYVKQCEQYVKDNEQMMTTHPRWPTLARKIEEGLRQTSD